jgi:hypothetical protein
VGRKVTTGRNRNNQETGTEGKTLVGLTKQNELYTDSTSINTQGIMGKMGDTWRGVETENKGL